MTTVADENPCPVGDPECLGNEDECHDACEAPDAPTEEADGPRCPKCGGDQIAQFGRTEYRQDVSTWKRNDKGAWEPDAWGDREDFPESDTEDGWMCCDASCLHEFKELT